MWEGERLADSTEASVKSSLNANASFTKVSPLYCFFLLNRLKRFSFSFSLSFSLFPGLDSLGSV